MNYKGMNLDMTCRGFQYEVGKEYEEKKANVCECGFHACEYPLDVFNYYPPNSSRYFEVEQGGEISKSSEDSKVSSTKIKIGAEVSIAGLVKAAVEYTKERAKLAPAASATGDREAASATGYRGAASATGYQGAASATGYQGAASATGYRGAASATGDRGAASATGYRGAASATGYQGAASATGYQGAASATGDDSVALASGENGRVMGALGCVICCVERGDWNGKTFPIKNVKAAIVDGKSIKAYTWYTLKNGEFVEVSDEDD